METENRPDSPEAIGQRVGPDGFLLCALCCADVGHGVNLNGQEIVAFCQIPYADRAEIPADIGADRISAFIVQRFLLIGCIRA